MICPWKELLSILPQWLRSQLSPYEGELQELRMRCGRPAELVLATGVKWLTGTVAQDDLNFCVNTASRYSPWAATTVSQGYITAPGGHRIGICGEAVMKDGQLSGIRTVRSLCIRVARDFPGLARRIHFRGQAMLILGAPGWGKTTLLRDISRAVAEDDTVAVVDERQELFPPGFPTGKRMDILYGCSKRQGIETVLRTMGPDCIAVDEITAQEDCQALIHASGCGVRLIATAHAAGMSDFRRRSVYSSLRESRIFDTFLILDKDKSFHLEEIYP
ncbi:MAG: ATPase, T2SS/T4P/T4SS family [Faecousia sp.]